MNTSLLQVVSGNQERFLPEFTLSFVEGFEMTMGDFLVVSEKHSDALNLLTLACRMGLCKKGRKSVT